MSKDGNTENCFGVGAAESDAALFNQSKGKEATAKQPRKLGVAVAALGALTLCSGGAAATAADLDSFSVGRLDIDLTAHDGFKQHFCSSSDLGSTDGSGSGGNSDSVGPSSGGGNLNEINGGGNNPEPEQGRVFVYTDYNPNDTSYDPNSIYNPRIEESHDEVTNLDAVFSVTPISSVDPSRLIELGVPEVYFEREPDNFDPSYENGSVRASDSEQINPFSSQDVGGENPWAGESLQEYFVVTTEEGLWPRSISRPGADIDDLNENWYNEVVSNSSNSHRAHRYVYDPEQLEMLRDFVRGRPNKPQWTASDEERYSPENIDNFLRPNYNDPRYRNFDSDDDNEDD
ncbi:MAG: hypothetical protein K2X56_15975 [Mycobacterium pseudokansasii]|uniref:Uncharacterized protein n=1 Tax=Mycobacterium pseudokansasii TaxID=2341080 RepID=A0A498QHF1_9MYCO|nr:hypothetical protein [Mycobacterium pseudokansasii]MBY0389552.1 hypothetical protein [Mycobacterium pseudokansasii]VAZ87406.1 hypothetical protein LAUMK35_00208 [Mycobacterium pseudokansasii]VAZ87820.1 hypothetical protein LAUMK21_00206 [Mycobacterium pseudokansasii]VBA45626.1 hypothetical protein LAUMK142_00064 [Mycobacterium pseudokansasii]